MSKRKTTTRSRGTARGSRGSLSGASLDALREELDRRVRDLEEERAGLQHELDRVDAQLRAITASGVHGMGVTTTGRPRKRPQNDANLVDSLASLLKGKTMSVTHMAQAVQDAGYRTTSPNFRTIVNQTLINHPTRFKRVSRGKYTAKR